MTAAGHPRRQESNDEKKLEPVDLHIHVVSQSLRGDTAMFYGATRMPLS
jgi:hypothetical protein